MIKKFHNYASNTLYKFFKELKTNHKFLFIALILSFILSALPCFFIIAVFFENKQYGFIFFVPFLIILIINIIAIKIFKHIPKITKFITFILNSFIIVIIQMFCALFLLSFMIIANDEYMRDKPEFYEKVLTSYPEERTAHFPRHIPQNATNVEMDADMWSFQGGQSIYIKFDIDKDYIDKELKKYKFKSKESNNNNYICGILMKDYILYIIDGKYERFGKFSAIGVNKKSNTIIYFYCNED